MPIEVNSGPVTDLTHRTCGACFPGAKLGDTVKTRCGLTKTIEQVAPSTTCVVCADMANRFPCGPGCAADISLWW